MHESNKDAYERMERMIKRIEHNADKLTRVENFVDKMEEGELKFQSQVAILNHHRKFL